MSVRRHIGNPEVRARPGPRSRRGRAHRKRLHVGREGPSATSAGRKAGSGGREEGSGEPREAGRAGASGRGGGRVARGRPLHVPAGRRRRAPEGSPCPQAARPRTSCLLTGLRAAQKGRVSGRVTSSLPSSPRLGSPLPGPCCSRGHLVSAKVCWSPTWQQGLEVPSKTRHLRGRLGNSLSRVWLGTSRSGGEGWASREGGTGNMNRDKEARGSGRLE